MVNLDFIFGRQVDSAFRHERFEYGAEISSSDSDIDDALARLSRLKPATSPGGSALNTIASVAATNSPVRVGYIGCCGTRSHGHFDFRDWFSLLGINTSFIDYRDGAVGRCVSYGVGDDRAMLTSFGVNRHTGDHFHLQREKIFAYLSAARAVHITPFTGVDDLSPIADILCELKERHPSVLLSCDPGHFWTEPQRPKEADRILGCCDLLILTKREFGQLSRRLPAPAMSDADAAQRCMSEFLGVQAILVLKSYKRAILFSRLGREVLQRTYSGRSSTSPDDVVDDTGAGDSFAAGFLLGRLLPGFDTADCVEFGLSLANRKLTFSGMTGVQSFADEYTTQATRLLSRSTEDNEDALSGAPKVFVGHGQDASWLILRDRLRSWGLQPTYFEVEPQAGRFVNDILASQALNADFAVITMTGDDRDDGGRVRSRQNVVHEIGLMQGRLGWDRVAILLEEGVERFTNLDGFQYISFAKGRISQAFDDLHRVLEREGLVNTP